MITRKGFTLIELMIGVVIFSVIAGLVTYGGSKVVNRMVEHSGISLLNGIKSDAERIASRRNYEPGDQTLFLLPSSEVEFISKSKVKNVILTTEESTNKAIVSIKLIDQSSAIYAVNSNNKCLILLHTVGGKDGWAKSENLCIAANYVSNSNWSEDEFNPAIITS